MVYNINMDGQGYYGVHKKKPARDFLKPSVGEITFSFFASLGVILVANIKTVIGTLAEFPHGSSTPSQILTSQLAIFEKQLPSILLVWVSVALTIVSLVYKSKGSYWHTKTSIRVLLICSFIFIIAMFVAGFFVVPIMGMLVKMTLYNVNNIYDYKFMGAALVLGMLYIYILRRSGRLARRSFSMNFAATD
jgi:hypothetical protein